MMTFLLAMTAALSAHVVMLQLLHVPYPDHQAVPRWVKLFSGAVTFEALTCFCMLARSSLNRWTLMMQCAAVFTVYAMTRETLRGMVMNGVVTTSWSYALLAGIPAVAYLLIQSIAALLCARWLHSYRALLVGAVIFGVLVFAVQPLIENLAHPVLEKYAYLAHDEVYTTPYGWHVLVPAYLTYLEPGVGCLAAYVLVRNAHGDTAAGRVIRFSILYLIIRGVLLTTLLWSFFLTTDLLASFISESQFLIEFLTLAVLTAIGWERATASPSVDESANLPSTGLRY